MTCRPPKRELTPDEFENCSKCDQKVRSSKIVVHFKRSHGCLPPGKDLLRNGRNPQYILILRWGWVSEIPSYHPKNQIVSDT